jgi:hypothetical protein
VLIFIPGTFSQLSPLMFESTSPFDDALSKPFLDEPVKKRWWLGRTVPPASSQSSDALSHAAWGSSSAIMNTHPPNSHAASAVVLEDEYPDLEAIEFKNQDDDNFDELLGLMPSPSSSLGRSSAGAWYDRLDFAIIRERHQDLTDINKSLLELNEIEKGKK